MPAVAKSTPSSSPRDLIPWALDTLKIPEGRTRRIVGGAAMAAALVGPTKALVEKVRERLAWSIVVDASDDLYADLHQWLLEQLPEHRRRSLAAHTVHHAAPSDSQTDSSMPSTDPQPVHNAGEGPRQSIDFRYDSSRTQTVELDGHRITVAIEKEEGSGFGAQQNAPEWAKPRSRIRLTAYTLAGRHAIEDFLGKITEARYATGRTPRLNLANRWGGWELRRDLPPRSIDTVALPFHQLEDLVVDLEQFLAQEHAYSRLGVPWHRGYLLVGPPGTGKSSIARAIATYLGLDLYYVPLGDLQFDANLLQLMGSVAPRSIVLFEDIDVLTKASHNRDKNDGDGEGVTLSGLLNALDGVATPHGLITFMTTNDGERLDPALIRPGRMDRRFEIGFCTVDQVLHLWRIAFPDNPMRPIAHGQPPFPEDLAPATVVGMLTAHVDDLSGAIVELEQLTGWTFEAAPRCIGCGCTDDEACAGGCSWAQTDPPVCSRCDARSTTL